MSEHTSLIPTTVDATGYGSKPAGLGARKNGGSRRGRVAAGVASACALVGVAMVASGKTSFYSAPLGEEDLRQVTFDKVLASKGETFASVRKARVEAIAQLTKMTVRPQIFAPNANAGLGLAESQKCVGAGAKPSDGYAVTDAKAWKSDLVFEEYRTSFPAVTAYNDSKALLMSVGCEVPPPNVFGDTSLCTDAETKEFCDADCGMPLPTNCVSGTVDWGSCEPTVVGLCARIVDSRNTCKSIKDLVTHNVEKYDAIAVGALPCRTEPDAPFAKAAYAQMKYESSYLDWANALNDATEVCTIGHALYVHNLNLFESHYAVVVSTTNDLKKMCSEEGAYDGELPADSDADGNATNSFVAAHKFDMSEAIEDVETGFYEPSKHHHMGRRRLVWWDQLCEPTINAMEGLARSLEVESPQLMCFAESCRNKKEQEDFAFDVLVKAHNKFAAVFAKYTEGVSEYNALVTTKDTALAQTITAFESFHPVKEEMSIAYGKDFARFDRFDTGADKGLCGLSACQAEQLCQVSLNNRFEDFVDTDTCVAIPFDPHAHACHAPPAPAPPPPSPPGAVLPDDEPTFEPTTPPVVPGQPTPQPVVPGPPKSAVDFPAVDLDATIPTADAPVVHNAGTDAWEQAESDAAQGKLRVDKLEEQLDVAIKATALADQNVADLEEQLESAVAAAAQLTDSAAAEALRAIEIIREDLADAKTDAWEAHRTGEALQQQLADSQNEHTEAVEIATTAKQLVGALNSLAEAEAALEDTKSARDELKVEIKEARVIVQAAVDAADAVADIETKLADANAAAPVDQDLVKSLSETLAEAKTDLKDAQAASEAATKLVDTLLPELQNLENTVATTAAAVTTAQAVVTRIKQGDIVAETTDTADEAYGAWKNAAAAAVAAGEVVEKIETKIDAAETAIAAHASATAVVEELKAKLETCVNDGDSTCVATLETELAEKEAGLSQTKIASDKASNDLAVLNAQLTAAQDASGSAAQAVDDAKQIVDAITTATHETDKADRDVHGVDALASAVEDAQYAEAEAMGGVSDLKEEIAEARAVIDAMDDAQTVVDGITTQVAEAQAAIDAHGEQARVVDDVKSALKDALATKPVDEANVESLNTQLTEAAAALADLTVAKTDAETKKEELLVELKDAEVALVDAIEAAAEPLAKIDDLKAELVLATAALSDATETVDTAKAALETATVVKQATEAHADAIKIVDVVTKQLEDAKTQDPVDDELVETLEKQLADAEEAATEAEITRASITTGGDDTKDDEKELENAAAEFELDRAESKGAQYVEQTVILTGYDLGSFTADAKAVFKQVVAVTVQPADPDITVDDVVIADVVTYTDESASLGSKRAFTSKIDVTAAVNACDESGWVGAECVMNDWDVSAITNFGHMLRCSGAVPSDFNQDISSWETGQVTDMNNMLAGCASFNQDISGWDMSSVQLANGFCSGCSAFDADVSGWNPKSATNWEFFFNGATSLTADLSGWQFPAGYAKYDNLLRNAKAFTIANAPPGTPDSAMSGCCTVVAPPPAPLEIAVSTSPAVPYADLKPNAQVMFTLRVYTDAHPADIASYLNLVEWGDFVSLLRDAGLAYVVDLEPAGSAKVVGGAEPDLADDPKVIGDAEQAEAAAEFAAERDESWANETETGTTTTTTPGGTSSDTKTTTESAAAHRAEAASTVEEVTHAAAAADAVVETATHAVNGAKVVLATAEKSLATCVSTCEDKQAAVDTARDAVAQTERALVHATQIAEASADWVVASGELAEAVALVVELKKEIAVAQAAAADCADPSKCAAAKLVLIELYGKLETADASVETQTQTVVETKAVVIDIHMHDATKVDPADEPAKAMEVWEDASKELETANKFVEEVTSALEDAHRSGDAEAVASIEAQLTAALQARADAKVKAADAGALVDELTNGISPEERAAAISDAVKVVESTKQTLEDANEVVEDLEKKVTEAKDKEPADEQKIATAEAQRDAAKDAVVAAEDAVEEAAKTALDIQTSHERNVALENARSDVPDVFDQTTHDKKMAGFTRLQTEAQASAETARALVDEITKEMEELVLVAADASDPTAQHAAQKQLDRLQKKLDGAEAAYATGVDHLAELTEAGDAWEAKSLEHKNAQQSAADVSAEIAAKVAAETVALSPGSAPAYAPSHAPGLAPSFAPGLAPAYAPAYAPGPAAAAAATHYVKVVDAGGTTKYVAMDKLVAEAKDVVDELKTTLLKKLDDMRAAAESGDAKAYAGLKTQVAEAKSKLSVAETNLADAYALVTKHGYQGAAPGAAPGAAAPPKFVQVTVPGKPPTYVPAPPDAPTGPPKFVEVTVNGETTYVSAPPAPLVGGPGGVQFIEVTVQGEQIYVPDNSKEFIELIWNDEPTYVPAPPGAAPNGEEKLIKVTVKGVTTYVPAPHDTAPGPAAPAPPKFVEVTVAGKPPTYVPAPPDAPPGAAPDAAPGGEDKFIKVTVEGETTYVSANAAAEEAEIAHVASTEKVEELKQDLLLVLARMRVAADSGDLDTYNALKAEVATAKSKLRVAETRAEDALRAYNTAAIVAPGFDPVVPGPSAHDSILVSDVELANKELAAVKMDVLDLLSKMQRAADAGNKVAYDEIKKQVETLKTKMAVMTTRASDAQDRLDGVHHTTPDVYTRPVAVEPPPSPPAPRYQGPFAVVSVDARHVTWLPSAKGAVTGTIGEATSHGTHVERGEIENLEAYDVVDTDGLSLGYGGDIKLPAMRDMKDEAVSVTIRLKFTHAPENGACLFHMGNGDGDAFQIKVEDGVLTFQASPSLAAGGDEKMAIIAMEEDVSSFVLHNEYTIAAVLGNDGYMYLYVDGDKVAEGNGMVNELNGFIRDVTMGPRRDNYVGTCHVEETVPLSAGILAVDVFDGELSDMDVAMVSGKFTVDENFTTEPEVEI